MVIQKKIGFEFIEVGDFKAPAGNASKQCTQHGIIKVRGRGKDNVPEINVILCQRDSEHAGIRGVILVIADDSCHRFFVDTNAPDLNGLANP